MYSDDAKQIFADEPSFDEHVARAEIERDVRGEYSEALDERRRAEQDRRILALVISTVAAVSLLAPLAAFLLGFSWRLMLWAAGKGW